MAVESLISSAGAGLNFFEGWENTKSSREEAKLRRESIKRQLGLLDNESRLVNTAYSKRRGIATDMFGNKMENLSSKIGFQLSDINRGYESSIAKSGLAISGSLEDIRNRGFNQTQTEGKFQQETLRDQLGKELMELDIWKASETGRIAMEKEKLQGEESIYKAIENQKYLGLPDWVHETLGWTPF